MAVEIIDYLFVFWAILAAGVFVISKIYESQAQSKIKRHKRETPDAGGVSQPYDYNSNWSNRHTGQQQDPYQSSTSYNNNYGLSNVNQSNSSQFHGRNYQSPISSSLDPYTATSGYNSFTSSSAYSSGIQPTTESHLGRSYDGGSGSYGSSNAYINRQYNDPYNLSSASESVIDNASGSQLRQESQLTEGFIPTATGFNADCVDWVNSILYLFYTQPQKYGSMIAESINRSLNEKLSHIASKSTEFNDLIIEFNGINREQCSRPELANIRTEVESENSINATCKIYNERISFNLTIQKASISSYTTASHNRSSVSNLDPQMAYYELILEKLEGKLKCIAVLNDEENLIVVQFLEKPDMKILLKPSTIQTAKTMINEDTLVQLILQTLTHVLVDLDFRNDIDFPRFKPQQQHQSAYANYKNKFNNIIKDSANEIKRRKHDIFGALTSSSSEPTKERKVYVKIVRANNINYNQNVTCLMELDAPMQQKLTSTKQGSSNPQWDEPYLFQINDKSTELIFELWDSLNINVEPSSGLKRSGSKKGKSNENRLPDKADMTASAKFLGSAKVKVEELRRNPVQKISLNLESNRKQMTNVGLTSHDLVGGELQVELQYIEHSSSHSQSQSPSSIRKSASSISLSYQPGDTVSIDRKLTSSGLMIIKTTITKPLNKQQHRDAIRQSDSRLQYPQQDQLLITSRNQSPISSLGEHSDLLDVGNVDAASSTQVSTDIDQLQHTGETEDNRGRRSRSRSRSLLRAIKKRFSFSRSRSRSLGGGEEPEVGVDFRHRDSQSAIDNKDNQSIRSRSRASSVISTGQAGLSGGGRAKSLPVSRKRNEVPTIVINKGRLSDGFSRPRSQLVYECIEPCLDESGHNTTTLGKKDKGIARYYAVPDNATSKRKWRKRGTKLHLFKRHQFVACHLPSSSTCHNCGGVFSRRPGKQGYKCRNCDLISHKECHTRADHDCPYPGREELKLEYIDADPPASLVEDVLRSSDTGGQNYQPYSNEQPTRPMSTYTSIARQGISLDES